MIVSAGQNGLSSFVGREREIERFRGAFERMLSERRQILLICGEPGIGKTRLAEELAIDAEDKGALVLWGRCLEEPGAPPFWPWTQILRAYFETSSTDELRMAVGPDLAAIAAILPELADTSDGDASMTSLHGSGHARFRTFDAVARFFANAAREVPLTLVFDNLHWADAPSLSLLEFLCHEFPRGRMLAIGTYRDGEVSRHSAIANTLGGLSGERDVDLIRLGGLSETAIAEFSKHLCGTALPAAVLGTIYRQTDGNPLFARELIKVLVDESSGAGFANVAIRIPDSVREAIGRRLSRLGDECNSLLATAAVFGRHFTATELAAASVLDVPLVLEALDPAVRARIIESEADAAGSYCFTHALIRETLYDELSALDRVRLHGRAGMALKGLHPTLPAAVLPRLAHHYCESASLGNADEAADFAMRAAQAAFRMSAHEEALTHYDQVIDVLDLFGSGNDERLVAALLGKGTILKELGHVDDSIVALLQAAHRIRELGSPALLVDAIMRLALSSSHTPQRHIVPLLEASLEALPEDDSPARAQAIVTLAFAYRSTSDSARSRSLVEEGLAMAKRVRDRVVLCYCYNLSMLALRGSPDTLQYRASFGREYLAVARSVENPELIAEAYHWQSLNLVESGQLDDLEHLLRGYAALPTTEFGVHQYRLAAYRIVLALVRGEWTGLEERIDALREMGSKTRRDDAEGVFGAQMFALDRDLGRLPALAPAVQQFISAPPASVWQPGLMLMCTELDMLDDARRIFESLAQEKFAHVCKDDMYVTCLVFCTEVCARLSDAETATVLYELLLPYAGQTANHPIAVCYGSVHHYLAVLARTMGDTECAGGHFERALERHRSMRAWPWLARTRLLFGSMLNESPDPGLKWQGREHLNEAARLAEKLRMEGIAGQAYRLLHSEHPAGPDGLTAREVEVLELLAMGRSNKDVSKVLSISLNTVATHVKSILNKSGCANRTEAAAYALRHRLAPSQD